MTEEVVSSELLLRLGRNPNAFEETVQRLLQSIRLGVVGPGQRLPSERELAAMVGVSRDTVREAIGSLAEAGYVVVRRGRYGGTFVADELPEGPSRTAGSVEHPPITRAEVEDVLVLRTIVEVGTARQAALRQLTAADRERLWQAHSACEAADPGEYRRHDSRLHLLIAELVGSPSLLPLVADLRMRVNNLLDGIPLLSPNIAHSNEQHAAIVTAILRGDADGAGAAMAEHIAGSAALLRGFLA